MKEWDDLNELFRRPQFTSDSFVGGDIEGSSQDFDDHDNSSRDND